MPELAARPHHSLEDYPKPGITGEEAGTRFAGRLFLSSLSASVDDLAGRNTTRPGGMAVPRTRAGLYELQVACAKLYFCPHNPAQMEAWSGEFYESVEL